MTYFRDLMPCDYSGLSTLKPQVAVGWLEPPFEFPRGTVKHAMRARLEALFSAPWGTGVFMGSHACGFCAQAAGIDPGRDGQIINTLLRHRFVMVPPSGPAYRRYQSTKGARVARWKRFALTCSAATAAAISVPSALGGMHAKLAARLSGMGEHGVVNLQVKSKSGQLCWTFDLPTTKGVTGASIHVGSKGVVLIKLGKTYKAKGCTKASAMTLEHLETKPAAYWVFVDTKGHPGELRGKLFAGTAHM